MYHHLSGIVVHRRMGEVVLEVGGVGYQIHICGDIQVWPLEGEEIKVFTHLVVRENEMYLCGFLSTEERDVFLQLIKVSGVGPTLGLQLLGQTSLHRLISDVVESNVASLTRLKGVGKKTAERIVVELRDKLKVDENRLLARAGASTDFPEDALLALIALGYSSEGARECLMSIVGSGLAPTSTDDWVRLALKHGR